MESRNYFPNGSPALSFLERTLAAARPDVVLAHPSTYAFTVTDVAYAVRDRFGERAERLFESAEARFRGLARETGRAGEGAEGGARRIARKVFGRAPMLSEAVATETWLKTLDRLAQHEAVQTFAHAPFKKVAGYAALYPESVVIRDRFTKTFQERALSHRFGWIDVEPSIAAAPGGREACFQPDLVHRNELGHDVTLRFVVETLRTELAR